MTHNISSVFARYDFTPDELEQISIDLANKIEDKANLDAELKAVKSDFKSKIDKVDAEISLLSSHRRNGYENRMIRCRVVKDYGLKLKYFYSTHSGKRVKTESFSDSDFQLEIGEQMSRTNSGDGAPVPTLPDDMNEVTAVLDYFEAFIGEYPDPIIPEEIEDLPGELERTSQARYLFDKWRRDLEVSLTDEEFDRINETADKLKRLENDVRELVYPKKQAEAAQA